MSKNSFFMLSMAESSAFLLPGNMPHVIEQAHEHLEQRVLAYGQNIPDALVKEKDDARQTIILAKIFDISTLVAQAYFLGAAAHNVVKYVDQQMGSLTLLCYVIGLAGMTAMRYVAYKKALKILHDLPALEDRINAQQYGKL